MRSLQKAIRSEVIKKVLDAYPEFHYNLGAFAILKDAILIGRMSSFDTAKEIAKQYPILITSAEFVTQTMREHLALTKKDLSQNTVPSKGTFRVQADLIRGADESVLYHSQARIPFRTRPARKAMPRCPHQIKAVT